VNRWHLDSPKHDSSVEESFLLRGWAIAKEERQLKLHFAINLKDETYSHPMNFKRHDVGAVMQLKELDTHNPFFYGFELGLERKQIGDSFRLGFETDGLIQWVVTLSIAG